MTHVHVVREKSIRIVVESNNYIRRKNMKKNNISKIFKIIFILSLLVYIFGFIESIIFSIIGVNYNNLYLGPSMSLLDKVYGFKAFRLKILDYFIFTLLELWFIPLYQLIYIIIFIIFKFINKNKHNL